ncbi:MAG: patatin-like phospholipase family protein [Leptospiraceae bacterium]|nr:patatin-like phospholipase family protein [Leptospiraceae bacterium]
MRALKPGGKRVDQKLDHRHFLLAQPLFENVPPRSPAFQKFIQEIQLRHFEKDEIIYRRGDESNHFYLVRDGEIQIRRQEQSDDGADSRNATVFAINRGGVFGEVSFLTGEAHSSYARASLDSMVYCVPGKAFLKLLSLEPAVGQNLALELSRRVRRAHSGEKQETPARVHTLFYPEDPRRGSELCLELGRALNQENPDAVLLLNFNRYSVLKSESFPLMSLIWNRWPNVETSVILDNAEHAEGGFDVLAGHEVFDSGINSDAIVDIVPAILGRLKKYYSAILIDAGRDADHPVVARALSQSDRVMLARNPRTPLNSPKGNLWKEVTAFCTEHIDDFFTRVITISDEKGGRRPHDDSETWASINPYSALYRNHIRLRSVREASLQIGTPERAFQTGINRLARMLSGTRRGLVLSGGGARAFAHIGVLEVLDQAGIDFDVVAGTSMGSVVGAGYALGKDAREIEAMVAKIIPDSKAILDKTIPLISFFRGHKLNRAVLDAFGDARFEDTEIPFYCNGTDLDSGQSIVFERGYISTAVRGSVSLPGVFPPLKLGRYNIVDGGVINNLPGSILRDKGYNRIIGVNVSPLEDPHAADTAVEARRGSFWERFRDYFSLPPIIKIVNRSIAIQGVELLKFRLSDFEYVFHPPINRFDVFDFNLREQIIEIGRRSARDHLPEIQAALSRARLNQ